MPEPRAASAPVHAGKGTIAQARLAAPPWGGGAAFHALGKGKARTYIYVYIWPRLRIAENL